VFAAGLARHAEIAGRHNMVRDGVHFSQRNIANSLIELANLELPARKTNRKIPGQAAPLIKCPVTEQDPANSAPPLSGRKHRVSP
jgi:hypothetical protein